MTCQIDLSLGGDRRDAIHQIVECLVGGGVARLNTETGDDLVALATHTDATSRLISLKAGHDSALMVSSFDGVTDFVPRLSSVVSRLYDRSTTPIHISIAEEVDGRIIQQLSPQISELAESQGDFRFAIPVSLVIRDVVRLVPAPAAVVALDSKPCDGPVDLEVIDEPRRTMPVTVVRFRENNWTLTQAGSLSEEDISRMMAERIVFVCTGNTCRSPMAEGMFRKLLAERLACSPQALSEHGFDVASAGVAAIPGAPASPESVAICADHGVDLRLHASQPLQQQMLETSDRLYTMTAGHRDAIQDRFPEYAERVQLLSRQGRDVIDPIGSGQLAYERCFSEITEHLQALVDELTAPPHR